MIRYLIHHPISVLMLFTVFFIIGMSAYLNVPVSLLPDIAIPEITVRISGQNISARELEHTVVSPVRQQLLQVNRLRDIRSEARDGSATIRLSFEYGANTDLAFIEVNEKVDGAMGYLPKEIDRPRVIKASATDVPVMNLNLTFKDSFSEASSKPFSELSSFAENVVRRRIEQLPQVAMVDMTGMVKDEVVIIPDPHRLEAGDFTLSDIEAALSSNNYSPGSIAIRDGYYEYNIRFSAVLRTVEDIRNIYFSKNGRIYQLKDLARVEQVAEKERGMAVYNGKRAVVLAVIKQSEASTLQMQQAIDDAVEQLAKDYPEVAFNISQNQTELLDYTISNLKQNLLLAFIFVCLVSFIFLRDMKSPLIIGLSMFVSLVVSLLFFYLFHISLNVVSLTGLILALGMMIDNSIIVTDNIGQHRVGGLLPIGEACIKGANEVVAPMLSSMLTTIAIFVPLIFLSGIAGALFFDQAFSVTVGLLVSYVTGIMLLPVLYKLVYAAKTTRFRGFFGARSELSGEALRSSALFRAYDCGIGWVFRHKILTAAAMLAVFPICFILFTLIRKEKMPDLHQNEMLVTLDWNENIHVRENYRRSLALFEKFSAEAEEMSALIGQQQLMLGGNREQTSSEAEIYVKTKSSDDIFLLKQKIEGYLSERYPRTQASFSPTGTIFEKIFSIGDAGFVVEYYGMGSNKELAPRQVLALEKNVATLAGAHPEPILFQNQLNFRINREKLLLYNMQYDAAYKALKTAFKENQLATLRSQQLYLPIVLGGDVASVKEVMERTLIDIPSDADGTRYKLPLSAFVKVSPASGLKTIVAGKSGEYIPFVFSGIDNVSKAVADISRDARNREGVEVAFSGSAFSNVKMINELSIILLISILLMYFILAAQFENLVQPLIVLAEIPIDVAAALGLLMATGHSLNLMSAIGIIVTCGIIINDSILKVDVMNRLRKTGMPLMEVIHEAGRRRLKAILMTSFTSIVCMLPLFFSSDMGAELEKPLAIATIGGMLVGTPVSLFVVPLLYWWIYRK